MIIVEVPVLILKLKQKFRINMMWFTMLNVLEKFVTMNDSVGETERRIYKSMIDHSGDKNSHILKYQIEKGPPCP